MAQRGLITVEMSNHFPRMLEMGQSYPPSRKLDFPSLLEEQFTQRGVREKITPGMRVAVGVGSRGITNLKEIVKATLGVLIKAGARPFIVPAMGSHGGATAEGQAMVLAEYGITPESMGVPIEASMEVRKIGTAFDELEVVFSVPAFQADGVVVINRVKPHTEAICPILAWLQVDQQAIDHIHPAGRNRLRLLRPGLSQRLGDEKRYVG